MNQNTITYLGLITLLVFGHLQAGGPRSLRDIIIACSTSVSLNMIDPLHDAGVGPEQRKEILRVMIERSVMESIHDSQTGDYKVDTALEFRDYFKQLNAIVGPYVTAKLIEANTCTFHERFSNSLRENDVQLDIDWMEHLRKLEPLIAPITNEAIGPDNTGSPSLGMKSIFIADAMKKWMDQVLRLARGKLHNRRIVEDKIRLTIERLRMDQEILNAAMTSVTNGLNKSEGHGLRGMK